MLKAFPRRVNNGEVNTAIGLPFMLIPLLHFRNHRGALATLLRLLLLPLCLLRCLLVMADEPHPEIAQEERRPWMPPFDPSKPSVPISYPIMTLDALASRSYFDSFHFPFNKASLPLPSSAAEVLPARPRLLVCHDFKGGYQDNLWVQAGPTLMPTPSSTGILWTYSSTSPTTSSRCHRCAGPMQPTPME